ncbi:hypothetical protein PLICRDRAFT_696903 [Plicaturopsis crispa FD-325 SS-3]|nr:hypothetical protein PLICRDRAFT_696903 [Plicaturopsis crispa FD-325 SS-3]
MRGLKKVPSLAWSDFEHYLPPNCVDIPAVIKLLKKRRIIASNRWKAYGTDPITMEGNEIDVFRPLDSAVINKIITASKKCLLPESKARTQTCRPQQNPHRVVGLLERSDTMRPDGAMLLLDSEYEWDGIVVLEEFSKFIDGSPAYNNKRKAVWSMHYAMRNNMCRRFTFGITIDNISMRVWLCGRACIVVSDPFDFTTDLEKVIRVYSSLAFATKTELGWDPTLRVLPDVGHKEIDVFSGSEDERATYHIVRTIWDARAEFSQCRATRVHEVRDTAGNTFVIKDVWRDEDRESEGHIFNLLDSQIKEDDKRLFMGLIRHGDVYVDSRVDDTLNGMMRGKDIPAVYGYISLRPMPTLEDYGPGDHEMSLSDELYSLRRTYQLGKDNQRRVHYRIVFPGVGLALHELSRLNDRFIVLRDAVKALKVLMELNYIHRDVSVGNLLAFGSDGKSSNNVHGKLSDFEYAIDTSSTGPIDNSPKGTVDFMAVEVAHSSYVFLPRRNRKSVGKAVPVAPFRHNFLHDVESTWWIAMWNVFMHVPLEFSDSSWSWDVQMYYATEIFPGVVQSFYRHDMLTGDRDLVDLERHLPLVFRPMVALLEEARQVLVDAYEIAEESRGSIDTSAFAGVHDKIAALYKKMADLSGDITVQSVYDYDRALKRKPDAPASSPAAKRRKP